MGITTTQEIVLDFNRTKYNVILEHTDDENSRYILITCLSSGTLFELTDEYEIQLKVLTPDNKMLIISSKNEDSAITITDGKAKVLLTTAMLLVAGRAKAELVIKSGNSTLTSMPFEIEVVDGTYTQDALISDPDAQNAVKIFIAKMETYVSDAKGYRDESETIYESVKDKGTEVENDLAEIDKRLADSKTNLSEAETKLSEIDEKYNATKEYISEATTNIETIKSDTATLKSDVETLKSDTSTIKDEASTYATIAQSYAVGGTSTRDDEDTDNSKYYSEQAKKYRDEAADIAGGNFITKAEKGVANGIATLDENGNVPSTQISTASNDDILAIF